MDIPTTIHKISGTLMVRIPSEVVKEHRLDENMKANIVDVNDTLLEVHLRRL